MIIRGSSESKKCEGKLTISHPSGGSGEDVATINVFDANTGCTLFEVSVPVADFARAVLGMAHQPCSVEAWPEGVEVMGLDQETKTEYLPVGGGKRGYEYPEEETLKRLEVDGWIADRGEYNSHKVIYRENKEENNLHAVIYRRFVPLKVKS
jgi:hypothetical protein